MCGSVADLTQTWPDYGGGLHTDGGVKCLHSSRTMEVTASWIVLLHKRPHLTWRALTFWLSKFVAKNSPLQFLISVRICVWSVVCPGGDVSDVTSPNSCVFQLHRPTA